MTINHHITRDNFVQSQIFKNILLTGAKMASFLHKVEFNSSQQKESATQLVKSWSDACEGFANYEAKEWKVIRHAEIIEDITEYLAKAKAMLDMTLKSNFSDISTETLHNYFGELLSLLETIELVFEDLR